MKKGEESRQRLIECAAELFWKNGYSATGISEILKQTELPKGSFYFYFKSKDDLATAVTEYYQKILLEQFQNSSQGNDWESFIEEIFDFLSERTNGQTFAGCPYAVMGMETALSKPAVASVFMEGLKKFEQIFQEVLLCSGSKRTRSYVPVWNLKMKFVKGDSAILSFPLTLQSVNILERDELLAKKIFQ